MADMPDLDTSGGPFVSFFNVINDGGLTSVDPTKVIDSPSVNSYEQYDNGVVGTASIRSNPGADYSDGGGPFAVDFRFKTDGWLVVSISDPIEAFYPNIGGEYNPDTLASLGANGFIDLMQEFINELPPRTELDTSKVSYYNFSTPDAGTITLFQQYLPDYGYSGSGLSYTANTDRKAHTVFTVAVNRIEMGFEGALIATPGSGYDSKSGDVIQFGLMPQSGTVYQNTVNNNNNDSFGQHASATHIIFHTN